ncbi:N-formylglutamate amidohydrolase [Flavilitoribacter nigricans]|uniref:N-formylglutamate amidohydrolase n=1 Tax=Flavilitoribacter nigricans (strain ATCC 23147 / DSM 23189 / NBRC 102662 / NCIMB 1420 / SS-2) TaxID=1122177 RepID=A0A2D0N856_FLAN2|nr:N-formylglutamate amidohydrolase [Flavilitoribacter nigricans]PHN04578.1 N-formylglutamate amidohydrolase [Flavilitoribacter nigricans DSM 23189 = NBRC 102662]
MDTLHTAYTIERGNSPLITTAIHAGHEIRRGLSHYFQLSESDRLREEDPGTEIWADIGETRIIGRQSRFVVDLNRPPEKAIYLTPEDAWGLEVWQEKLPEREIEISRQTYNDFYADVRRLLDETAEKFGRFVVYDIHSYNHRREGPESEPADPEANPEVNIGTGSMDRKRWAPLVDGFIKSLQAYPFRGRQLDVRENVKFQGGAFSQWIHRNYPDTGCVLAIEFKKIYMDEWTGVPDRETIAKLRDALASTVPVTLKNLKILNQKVYSGIFD